MAALSAQPPVPSAPPLSPRGATSLPLAPVQLLSGLDTERLQLEIEAVQHTCDDIEKQLKVHHRVI